MNKLYILTIITILCFGSTSCGDDGYIQGDSQLVKDESWILTNIEVTAVETTDDAIYNNVLNYALNYRVNLREATDQNQSFWPYCSYRFTNDGKYYFSWGNDYGDPVSGTYTLDGNNLTFDDATMTGVVRNNLLHITTDLRSRAAKALGIDEALITKAEVREDYMHTIYYNPYY